MTWLLTLACHFLLRWKTLASELCLHLAMRLKPGDTSRGRLIERGIQMSAMAVTLSTTRNGTINHILAHDAQWGIEGRLSDLRNEDYAVGRTIVHDGNERFTQAASLNINTNNSFNAPTRNIGVKIGFASKFTIKRKTSSGTGSASSTATDRRSPKERSGLTTPTLISSTRNDAHDKD
jgi:hypothetical protein